MLYATKIQLRPTLPLNKEDKNVKKLFERTEKLKMNKRGRKFSENFRHLAIPK